MHHTLLGDGYGKGPSGETPRIVIQIDQSLLRGRRMYNRGRMLQGNEAISTDDQREFANMQEGGEEVNINRNFGRLLADPWIFGMVECHKQPDDIKKKFGIDFVFFFMKPHINIPSAGN
ncbi:hypothetical protein HZS_1591 [Henneguya salminicola]|nr:hypothetical protein HZS_1591 [Henneguya salminicola]